MVEARLHIGSELLVVGVARVPHPCPWVWPCGSGVGGAVRAAFRLAVLTCPAPPGMRPVDLRAVVVVGLRALARWLWLVWRGVRVCVSVCLNNCNV